MPLKYALKMNKLQILIFGYEDKVLYQTIISNW